MAAVGVAAAQEESDIWEDAEVLRFIQTCHHSKGLSAREKDRVYRRARGYRWIGSSLFKAMEGLAGSASSLKSDAAGT